MLTAPFSQTAMRLISVGIMTYDFVLTIPRSTPPPFPHVRSTDAPPRELRLYRRQKSMFALSHACKLFIAARYIGLTAVVSATTIFFSATPHHRCARLIPLCVRPYPMVPLRARHVN